MLKDLFTGKGISLPNRPTELRFQQNTVRSVAMLVGNLTGNQKSVTGGVSARVFDKGVHGFASAAETDPESVKKVLKAAAENAIFLGGRASGSIKDLPPIAGGEFSPNILDKDLPQKQIIDFVREVDAHIEKTYPDLMGRYVGAQCLDMEKFLFVSNGGEMPVLRSHSFVPRSIIYIMMTVKDAEGAPMEMYKPFGGYGVFADVFKNPKDIFADIAKLYEKVCKKAEGVYADAGVKQVVMAPDLAGILAHEAIGHTVEADIVLGGAVSMHYLNKPVASELVSMIDYAHSVNGKPAPVPVFVDDEGVQAKDAVLIEKGILKNFMHNRLTAEKMGHENFGNARAFAFSDEPLVRMRNTAIVPGTSKLEDMIASVEDGYYLVNPSNGQADSTSEFMFGVDEGYEIKNGKLGKAIRDTTISGVAFDLLKTVDMVSDDVAWSCSGMCGKKQGIPVGMGGPAVRCKVNIGGR